MKDDVRRPSWRFWLVAVLAAATAITVSDITDWLSEPAPNGSLLDRASVRAENAMGIPHHVLQGPMSPEGDSWFALERNVLLGANGGELRVDLDAPVQVGALLVQGMHLGGRQVESSLDGETWRVLWPLLPAADAHGMTSRHRVLDPPVMLRALRIRSGPAETRMAALGALRAYTEVPAGWPMRGPSVPVRVSPYPVLSIRAVLFVKFCVALLGASLLIAAWWLGREPGRRPARSRLVDVALIGTAVLAGFGWFNMLQYSSEGWERTHHSYWDATHYYLGAKYAPEIGYERLYHCILVADAEAGLAEARLVRPRIRKLATNGSARVSVLLANRDECKARFTPERWTAFSVDQAHLRTTLAPVILIKMLTDHGYNATPGWTVVGRVIGAAGPADTLRMRAALAIDPILLVLGFGLIATTFGAPATCAALILFGTGYVFGNWFTGGALLRFGWFAAAAAGLCCLKRERWALAGALLATSAMLRVFPVFLLGGVGLHALVQMLVARRWTPSPEMLRFGAAATATAAVIFAASLPAAGGIAAWQGFARNTLKHMDTSLYQNIGLGTLARAFDPAEPRRPAASRRPEPPAPSWIESGPGRLVRASVGALAFVLLVLAVRRQPAWVCAILGFAWMGFVLDMSNYYYCGMALFGLLIARAPPLVVPYAAFVVVWSGLGLVFDYDQPALYAVSSAALLAFSTSVLLWLALGPAAPGEPASPGPEPAVSTAS